MNLYKRKLLNKSHVHTYADYAGQTEADIEDMFSPDFYLKLVNGAFGASITLNDLSARASSYHSSTGQNILTRIHSRKMHPLIIIDRPSTLATNIGSLADDLSAQDLDGFERAFKTLNALL